MGIIGRLAGHALALSDAITMDMVELVNRKVAIEEPVVEGVKRPPGYESPWGRVR